MSFYDIFSAHSPAVVARKTRSAAARDVARALSKETLDENDLAALLSDAADSFLEQIALKARETTLRNFGKVIFLYTPLYLSNFCDNECLYCGFKRSNNLARRKLTLDEVEREADVISKTGISHVLALTGESRRESPLEYIKECTAVLERYFTSCSLEVYPLERDEYAVLAAQGVEGLTVYQETYDETLYDRLHLVGLKKNFRFRLDAPERACRAGMRSVSIGALLGLSDFRSEVFLSGLHAAYLQNRYPGTELSVSFPRVQPQTGNFTAKEPVTDRQMVRAMLALRLFMPRAGINISTRESGEFRKNIIGLGVTRMSAGSRTAVGGYALPGRNDGQFNVADTSSVGEVKDMIIAKGYQPVMKDWQVI